MAKNTNITIIRYFEQLLMKKPFERITVKDIAEKCGINRKTFYYYFSDMDDLLQKAFDWEITAYIESIPPEKSVEESISDFLNLLNEYKAVVYHAYNSASCEKIKGYIRQSMLSMIKSSMEHMLNKYKITREQGDIICSLYSYIFVGFVIDWLDSDMGYDLSEVVRQVRAMLNGTQETVLANAEKLAKE